MPRSADVYSLPSGSSITNGDVSDATDLNTPLSDIETDLNTARPILAGGTGATTASAARTNLEVVPGTHVQTQNATLQSIADNSGVDTAELIADAVTAAKIAAGAVDTSELAADAVTAAKIAAGAVDTSELAANAVTADKLDDTDEFLVNSIQAEFGSASDVAYGFKTAGNVGMYYSGGNLFFATNGIARMSIRSGNVLPDGTMNLGGTSNRWDTIFSNNALNTSDGELKEDVRELTAAELRIATRLRGLIRAYRFKDIKDRRIRFGVIAQDVIAAFEAEGLDAREYFIVDKPDDGPMSVSYNDLFAFILAVGG